MVIKFRVWSAVLFLVVLISVVLYGVMQVDNANAILPQGGATTEQVLRGRYLVTSVAGCADCHSLGRTPDSPYWLAGYKPGMPQQPFAVGPYKIYAPNITPDKETGIGNWTSQQIFNSLRQGKDDSGRLLCPPMPWPYYRNMTDRDTWAVVAYLKSIKPVKNEVPEPTGPGVSGGKGPDCTAFYKDLKPMPAYPAANEIRVSP